MRFFSSLLVAIAALLLAASGSGLTSRQAAILSGCNFAAHADTFNGASGTEIIPCGASQVVIEIWAPGGGGSRDTGTNSRGGGSGSYGKKTIALTPANWGQTIIYAGGAGGAGKTGVAGSGSNGSSGNLISSGTFTLTNILVNPGGGGVSSGSGAAGTVGSGGDTNTVGNAASTSSGAGAPNGGGNVAPDNVGSAPGGGGSGGSGANVDGSNGAASRVIFTYS